MNPFCTLNRPCVFVHSQVSAKRDKDSFADSAQTQLIILASMPGLD